MPYFCCIQSVMRNFTIFLFSFFFFTSSAQQPKREFRAAWIATVANIDWPSAPGLPADVQQQQFIKRLDDLKALGCNVVIVQVRPACDAFYDSKLEPWSCYLTGTQGQPPTPYYDPLTFMIEETHKRNMEFHAWFNPFRALMNCYQNPNPSTHVTRVHKDWIIAYGGKSYIDPGNEKAREYVTEVILDVVKRYDIDAVHLDDYFYPYKVPGKPFGDAKSYAKTGKLAGMELDDWRRDNVNQFITLLSSRIKQTKSYVKFGISPFGVWRNNNRDPNGSNTRAGSSCYDDLYSDVVLWMQKGWIDYLLPQLYWEHNHHSAAFDVLMPWWYGHCYKRHVYYGLGVYRMTESHSGAWAGSKELLWQLRDIRKGCPENSGYAFYSASCFDRISTSVKDSISQNIAHYPALPPAMPWIDSIPPAAPALGIKATIAGNQLEWKINNPKKEKLRYVVYRFAGNEPINLQRADKIISIQQGTDYLDAGMKNVKDNTYVVTALDRLWNESKPSNKVSGGR